MTSRSIMLNNVRIIMVDTTHPGNIGAAARALKTMGLQRLYLVNPYNFPSEEALRRASGATDVIDNIVVTDSLEAAIADCHWVIGTSARQRRVPWPQVDARQCGQVTIERAQQQQQVAIVFGREARGLTNDELQCCHYHMAIPTDDDYGVLNVAAAIQVVVYEVRMAWLAQQQSHDLTTAERGTAMPIQPKDWDEDLVNTGDMALFFDHFDRMLQQLAFYNPQNSKQPLTRLRRLFARTRLDRVEVSILRGIFSTVEQRLVQLQSEQKAPERPPEP